MVVGAVLSCWCTSCMQTTRCVPTEHDEAMDKLLYIHCSYNQLQKNCPCLVLGNMDLPHFGVLGLQISNSEYMFESNRPVKIHCFVVFCSCWIHVCFTARIKARFEWLSIHPYVSGNVPDVDRSIVSAIVCIQPYFETFVYTYMCV